MDKVQLPTAGHTLDHIGFDVKNLDAFMKRLEADGVKIERPINKNAQTGAERPARTNSIENQHRQVLWTRHRHDDRYAIFRPNRSGNVTLPRKVFRQLDAAGADLNRLSSRQYEFRVAAQRYHILAA